MAKAKSVETIIVAEDGEVVKPLEAVELPAEPKAVMPVADNDLLKEGERLLAGGAEDGYTLVPTFAAATNQTVEPTEVTVSIYTVCRKKA
jgi:hypothetical protein